MSNTDGIKTYFNISKICRVCLNETENMRSIFNSNLKQSEISETNVSEALFKVTAVKVSGFHLKNPEMTFVNVF